MWNQTTIRNQVHAELTSLLGPGGDLEHTPPGLDAYSHSTELLKFTRDFLEKSAAANPQGKAVIVTAGPPGAGKSSAVSELSIHGYRWIDPDVIKDLLLVDAEEKGLLSFRQEQTLSDQRCIGIRELATHVHKASTEIADLALENALAAGENVIIDGSLSWDLLPQRYVHELTRAGYENLTVVSIDAPLRIVMERARGRWWKGRNDEPLGGRFVPDSRMEAIYTDSGSNRCQQNAKTLTEIARDEYMETKLISYQIDPVSGGLRLMSD